MYTTIDVFIEDCEVEKKLYEGFLVIEILHEDSYVLLYFNNAKSLKNFIKKLNSKDYTIVKEEQ